MLVGVFMRLSTLVALAAVTVAGCANDAPVVELVQPTVGPFYADVDLLLQAQVNDDNHDLEKLVASWSLGDMELDGPTSVGDDGRISWSTRLPAGTHTLAVTVADPRGEVGTAETDLVVAETNTAPTCRFTAPTPQDFTTSGSETSVSIEVGDGELGHDGLRLVLQSDVDGDLGPLQAGADGGASASFALSPGVHQLSLTASDELGLSCTSTVSHVVTAPPTVNVNSPAPDFVQDIGVSLRVEATVADDLDPANDLGLTWRSDVDGVVSSGPADPSGLAVLETDALSRGPHTLTLTATDAQGLSAEDSISVLLNGPPDAPVISLTPAVPTTLADLSVVLATPSVDAEGDAVTYTYAWSVDETVVDDVSGPTVLSDRTTRDQTWRVRVTPNDGRLDGDVAEASVVVVNTAPTVTDVTLSPTDPGTNDVLTAVGTPDDVDGDAATLTYTWTVNGAVVAETGPTLDGAVYFDRGNTVAVTATPTDGTLTGTPVAAASTATVVNGAPTAPVVEMSTIASTRQGDVSCWLEEESVDPDGDLVTTTLTWEADGLAYPSEFPTATGPATDELPGDTVPAVDQSLADTFTCEVTVTDGSLTPPAATGAFDVVVGYREGYWREFPYTGILARNYLLGHPVVIPRDVYVLELGILAKRTSSEGKIALYTQTAAGQPGDLVVGSDLQRINVGDNAFPVEATRIEAGTYWIMAVYDSTAYPGEDRGQHTVYYQSMSAYGPFPESFTPQSITGYRQNYYVVVGE